MLVKSNAPAPPPEEEAESGLADVPFEVLAAIFAYLDLTTRVMVLPRVCRQWRAVAHHTVVTGPDARVSLAAEAARVDDELLFALGHLGVHIRSLDLTRCAGITEAGLAALTATSRDLGALTLAHTALGTLLYAVVSHLPSLRTLDLTGCPCPELPGAAAPAFAATLTEFRAGDVQYPRWPWPCFTALTTLGWHEGWFCIESPWLTWPLCLANRGVVCAI
jgi:hypothetical protein